MQCIFCIMIIVSTQDPEKPFFLPRLVIFSLKTCSQSSVNLHLDTIGNVECYPQQSHKPVIANLIIFLTETKILLCSLYLIVVDLVVVTHIFKDIVLLLNSIKLSVVLLENPIYYQKTVIYNSKKNVYLHIFY